MPDPTRKSVSASQMPALFGKSPYLTKWMLWQHFKNGLALPEPTHSRIGWGIRLQQAILDATADTYKLAIRSNLENAEYVRRGQIGHTRDGLMLAADVGGILVEAKNVDGLVWRHDWSETAAPEHIEIQLQTGIYADDVRRGIIAALVGGNRLVYYEREPNREFHERAEGEVADFFTSVANNNEPPPTGEPIELPMFLHLYPEADPETVVEDLLNPQWRDTLREFRFVREQQSFFKAREEQLRPMVENIARGAGRIRANSIECLIKKSPQEEAWVPKPEVVDALERVEIWAAQQGMVESVPIFTEISLLLRLGAWRQARKASIRTTFKFLDRDADPVLDDFIPSAGIAP